MANLTKTILLLIAATSLTACLTATLIDNFTINYYSLNSAHAHSATEMNIVQNPQQECTPYINSFNVSMIDQYDNTYFLAPVLMAVNKGNDNGTWTCYYYGLTRTYGGGNGNYGDVVAYLELWNAENLTQWRCVQYEFTRSGWGEFQVRINNNLVWTLPTLYPKYDPPANGMVEGLLFANGKHIP
jgi:hypothetical protein